ncbi:hypothetical protein A0U94_06525 [Gluconobacter albidus]|uniref:DnaB-like helicase C-terminal domain-containing protein n=1 Tax=Gluconobacter albidus TaxID=318683 RepID=UPI00098A1497|nr:DnaB-like helicase C-terminal domain-containing protein [Gluconobacter albidus]AQS90678.1 hypothetical protein A0U94_06525 [Gluconobacter albidus]
MSIHKLVDPGVFGGALRSVPQNIAAEHGLLGAVLVDSKKVLETVEEILHPDHFADPVNAQIYEKALLIYNEGRNVDPLIIIRHFEHPDELVWGKTNPKEYFAKLLTAYVSPRMAFDYAREIRDAAMRRQLMALCQRTADLCCRPEDERAEDIVEGHEARLLSIAMGMSESQPNVSLFDAGCEAILSAREALERGGGLAGLSWGYKALDRLTGGLTNGNLYIVGARPAVGKTSLGLGIALPLAASGKRGLFWSGEMLAKQVAGRAASARTGLNLRSIFNGLRWDIGPDMETGSQPPLEDWQWKEYENAVDEFFHIQLEIDTRPGLTISQLRSRARRMKRSKRGLDFIVLDYFQLMRGSAAVRGRGRYEETTEISNELKTLAKELDVPMIVLAQLNRKSEDKEDKTPESDHLRDTGALEQDADVICLIHRRHLHLKKQLASLAKRDRETEDQFNDRSLELEEQVRQQEGRGMLLVAKNRHGPTGVCPVWYDDSTTWFRDAGEDPRARAWTVQRGA